MSKSTSDHYEVLGVSPSATAEEIKKAYRKLMHRHHPDKSVNASRRDHEMAQMINAAWETLSDPEKRQTYDVSMRDKPKVSTEGTFILPENDGLNLLQGLIAAYKAPGDGLWDVRRATDANPTVPEDLFVTQREGTKVRVYRKITDWRDEWHNKNRPFIEVGYPPQKFNANDFLSEGALAKHPVGVHVPYNYDRYLWALKSLAAKIAYDRKNAQGNYDVGQETAIITNFLDGNTRYKREGRTSYLATESTRSIPFSTFHTELKAAEGFVRGREMPQRGKEGQTHSREQQRPSGGENLG